MVKVPDRSERNIKLHNKLFAIERMLVDNIEEYAPVDNTYREKEAARKRLHNDLMVVINQVGPDGKPKSIAHDAMDDETFCLAVYCPIRARAAQLLDCSEKDLEDNSVHYS